MPIQFLTRAFQCFFSILILKSLSLLVVRRRNRNRAFGFFHPFTNDGGGGERVLWCAIKAIQEEKPNVDCVIYTGDLDASSRGLMVRAEDRFGVKLYIPPKVVILGRRKWIEEKMYPHFTMIGQSLGSVYLAWEALNKYTPSYFVDTSGYAFTYPLAKLFGCKVFCYTHYPTISSDMIFRVRHRSSMYNNDGKITRSFWLSHVKIIYYKVFSWMYGIAGSHADVVMVNSSWTMSHIKKLWGIPDRTTLVYPPCDTSRLQTLPLERCNGSRNIISVAQFRPEKGHRLQLEAFAIAMEKVKGNVRLQFVGSCRNGRDAERLEKLKSRAVELGVDAFVDFYENVKYTELTDLLGGAIAGIHSMVDEHFGICIVEYMAAGAVPIAHRSGGPMLDIVLPEVGQATGYLAQTVEEYASVIVEVLQLPEMERMKIASAARRRADRFSEQVFFNSFKASIHHLIHQ